MRCWRKLGRPRALQHSRGPGARGARPPRLQFRRNRLREAAPRGVPPGPAHLGRRGRGGTACRRRRPGGGLRTGTLRQPRLARISPRPVTYRRGLSHPTRVRCLHVQNHRQRRRHDQHHPDPVGRDHRHQGGADEANGHKDDGTGADAARGVLAQPQGAEGQLRDRQQGPGVGHVWREPEVVCPHGRRVAGRLHLVSRLQLFPGVQREPRPEEGARGAAVARVGRVHAAGARRDGVRRSDEPDAADGHRRVVGPAARGARRGGAGRADGGHLVCQPHHEGQRGTRHRVGRLRGGVRPEAASRSVDGMSDAPFVTHRSLLFTVAYEMLGSAADAEDVVQEAWLRWADVDHAEVRDPRAYLVRIVTRQALNRLRSLARRREDYVGEWLPEPLLTSPDVAADIELAESVSIAMLTVLETLAPAERAVFVLREVFDTPYDEIAEAVGKAPAAVRQIAHRAKEHVAARRPRVAVSATDQQEVVDRFLAAVRGGDLQGLLDVLAPDVVVVADGGGLVAAVRRPLVGSDRVATLLSRLTTVAPGAVVGTAWLNGAPAGRIDLAGELNTAVSLVVADGRITRIYAIRNPHKLAWLDEEATLSR